MSVKSVYNFVPAPKENEVFKPDWADQVSHDIPFSDGESGEIELTITAKTPMFIRNGHSKKDAENNTQRYQEFSCVERSGKKEYFIPGSSLKGMFRNVLEIVSKSRMNRIDDKRHAVRQIMRTDGVVVDEGYELAQDKIKKTIKAGWLIYQDGKYCIYDCGRPYKIRNTDLDSITDNAFTDHFRKGGLAKLSDNFSNRTAKYKYQNVIGEDNLLHKFENHPLDENDKQSSWVSQFQKLNYVRFSDDNDAFYGHIVCVGQAAEYDVKTARKGEYVFIGKKDEVLSNDKKRLNLSKNRFEDFLFLNRNKKSDELEDWGYWKDKIDDGIPVFYRTEIKDNNEVLDFGLTFMYKQFAKYTTSEMEPKYLESKNSNFDLDFANIIFGTTDGKFNKVDDKPSSLKGRVMFSNAKLINEVVFSGARDVVLSTPRSSFFPFYVTQKGNKGNTIKYNTYNTGGELKGFKRYPVRESSSIYKQNLDGLSAEMKTNFNPLKEGRIFKGKIRFHNLRKVEIGALLSAITMHNTNASFHSIGLGKPLGYGKVSVSVELEKLDFSIEDYIKSFELLMLSKNLSWNIQELLSMANENSNVSIEAEYPNLKEFQDIKNSGKYLPNFSILAKNKIPFVRRSTTEELEVLKTKQEEDKKRLEQERIVKQQQKEEQIKKEKAKADKPYNDLIKAADDLFNQKKWQVAKEKYQGAIDLNQEASYPRQQKNKCESELNRKNLSLDDLNGVNDFNKGKKIIEEYYKANGNTIPKSELSIVKEFVFNCIGISNKRWKKKGKQDWKLVIKWIGQETAQKWFNELTKK